MVNADYITTGKIQTKLALKHKLDRESLRKAVRLSYSNSEIRNKSKLYSR